MAHTLERIYIVFSLVFDDVILDRGIDHTVRIHIGIHDFIAVQILMLQPEDDHISGLGMGDPACIDRLVLGKLISEFEFACRNGSICRMRCSVLCRIVPAAEFIAVSRHIVDVARRRGRFALQNKLRGSIGSTFAVFIEDQPGTFRLMHGERDVAGHRDRGIVRIILIHSAVGSRFGDEPDRRILDMRQGNLIEDSPAFEIVLAVYDIAHVDGIRCFTARIVYRIFDGSRTYRNRSLGIRLISHCIGFEKCCIVSDGFIFRDRLDLFHCGGSDLSDAEQVRIRGIGFHIRPSLEYRSIFQFADAGIVDDHLNVTFVLGIRLLDDHGSDLFVTALEDDRQSGDHGLHDNVNREVLRAKCEAVSGLIDIDERRAPVVFNVDDLQILSGCQFLGLDVDLDRPGRLDLAAIRVKERDIVCLIIRDLILDNTGDRSDLRSAKVDLFDLHRCSCRERIRLGSNADDRFAEPDRTEGSGSCGNHVVFDDLRSFLDQSFFCRRVCFFGRFRFFCFCRFGGFFALFGLFNRLSGFLALFRLFCRLGGFFAFFGLFCRLFSGFLAFLSLFRRLGGFFAFLAFFDELGCLFGFLTFLDFCRFSFDSFFGLFALFSFCLEPLDQFGGFRGFFVLLTGRRSLDVFRDLRGDGLWLGCDYRFAGLILALRKDGVSAAPHRREQHCEHQNERQYASPIRGSIQLSHTAFLSI